MRTGWVPPLPLPSAGDKPFHHLGLPAGLPGPTPPDYLVRVNRSLDLVIVQQLRGSK